MFRMRKSLKFNFGAFMGFVYHMVVFLGLICSCTGQPHVISPSKPILAIVGDDIILPCDLQPAGDATDISVEWRRPDLDPIIVHLWHDRVEQKSLKNPSFRERTTMFMNELTNGNISLKLSKVKLSDAATYTCFVPELKRSSTVHLVVGSVSTPFIQVIKNTSGVVDLHCESRGWYPEPEVLWLDSEGNLLSAGPTETVRGSDDLYTVKSRVTVDKSSNITCRVQQNHINHIRETQTHVSDHLFIVSTTSSNLNIVGWAVGAFVFLLFVLAVIFIVWKRRKNKFRKKSLEDGLEGGEDTKLNHISDKDKLNVGTEQEEESSPLIAGGEKLNNVCSSEKKNKCQVEHKERERNHDQVLTETETQTNMDRKEEQRKTTTVVTLSAEQENKKIEGQGKYEGEQMELAVDSGLIVADGQQQGSQFPLGNEETRLEARERNKDANYNNDHKVKTEEHTKKKEQDQEELKQQENRTEHMQQKTERQQQNEKMLQSEMQKKTQSKKDEKQLKAEKENDKNKKTEQTTAGCENEKQRDRAVMIESTADIQNVEEQRTLAPHSQRGVEMQKQIKQKADDEMIKHLENKVKKKRGETQNKKTGKRKENSAMKQVQEKAQPHLEEAKQPDALKREESKQQGSEKLGDGIKEPDKEEDQRDRSMLKESKTRDHIETNDKQENQQTQKGVKEQKHNAELIIQKNNQEPEDTEEKNQNTEVNVQQGETQSKKVETMTETQTEQQSEEKAQTHLKEIKQSDGFRKEQSQGGLQEETLETNKAANTEETRRVKEVGVEQQNLGRVEPLQINQESDRKGSQKGTRQGQQKAIRCVRRRRDKSPIGLLGEQPDVQDDQRNVNKPKKQKCGDEIKKKKDDDEGEETENMEVNMEEQDEDLMETQEQANIETNIMELQQDHSPIILG